MIKFFKQLFAKEQVIISINFPVPSDNNSLNFDTDLGLIIEPEVNFDNKEWLDNLVEINTLLSSKRINCSDAQIVMVKFYNALISTQKVFLEYKNAYQNYKSDKATLFISVESLLTFLSDNKLEILLNSVVELLEKYEKLEGQLKENKTEFVRLFDSINNLRDLLVSFLSGKSLKHEDIINNTFAKPANHSHTNTSIGGDVQLNGESKLDLLNAGNSNKT